MADGPAEPRPQTPQERHKHFLKVGAIAVLAVVVVASAVLYFSTATCMNGQPSPIWLSWSSATSSMSSNGKAFYDNISFKLSSDSYTVYGCFGSPPKTTYLSTASITIVIRSSPNGTGPSTVGAGCEPPQNFSSCGAAVGGWYVVLFDASSGVQSSAPTGSTAGHDDAPQWTTTSDLAATGEHLSVVSSTSMHGSGDTIEISGEYILSSNAAL